MTKNIEWPRRELAAVPRLKIAKDLAELVCQSCGLKDLKVKDALDKIYEYGKFSVNYANFSDELLAEALIFPMASENDRFGILVDTCDKSEEEMRYNSLHEVGHSFFYRRYKGDPPQRMLKLSDEEEIFCDEFASQLLKLINENDNHI